MLAITVNALYTTLRKRGTTRQLAGAIVLCVFSALLLLPAIVWFNLRFSSELSPFVVGAMLTYVAVWGWLVPLSITSVYGLFTRPRLSNTSASVHIPRLRNRTTRGNAAAGATAAPPKGRPGLRAPFVFGEDVPWGWLEHRGGRFQGQRLALERMVVTIGREEDNEVWLDDDTASRYHAELAWDQGQIYITDRDSLNGVVLNGRRIRGTMVVGPGDQIEIGAHRFVFEKAEPPAILTEQSDPLMRHVGGSIIRHSSFMLNDESLAPAGSEALPTTPPPQSATPSSAFIIRNGEMAGRSFLVDRAVLSIGCGFESDVIINDASISSRHAQVLRQADGDYVQDLAGSTGTKVNDELLNAPRLLQQSDIVCLGNILLEYTLLPEAQTNSLPPVPVLPLSRPISGPVPLRLPSRPKS